MHVNVPVLAVIGHKKSGKTTIIELLISELASRGLQVAAIKHVGEKGFLLDTKGKDTWRYSTAGANPVIAVSNTEVVIKVKNGTENIPLDRMIKLAEDNEADVLILEGFSSLVLKDKRVGRIVCLRNREEYGEFNEKMQGEVLAFCSFQQLGEPILNIQEGFPVIVRKVSELVEKRKKVFEILGQLAGLDCGKCGWATCEELAEAIYKRQASLEDCVPLKPKPKLKARIRIRDSEIPLQPFVSEIIRKSILGMVSSLKGVTVRGDEEVHITILSGKPKA
jgi:molybdopterin-guanine dinucleotide biosynthesis protein B